MNTLVIDKSGIPVSFVDWKRAASLCYTGKAHMLYEDESAILKSACFEMNMPRVIQLRNNISKKLFRSHVPFSRRNVAVRDESKCQFCDQVLSTEQYTFDHINPRSRGGESTWTNLVLACLSCNKKKADKTLKQSGMKLLREPVEPGPRDKRFNFKLRVNKVYPCWQPWKGYIHAEKAAWEYWNTELQK